MKLNNRGWGIREMFVLSAVLIFFFSIAIYFIYKLYNSLDLSLNDDSNYVEMLQYEAIEERLGEAAAEYLLDIDEDIDTNVVIYLSDLEDLGYINSIKDPNTDNLCDAYVEVRDNEIYPFVKCDKYKTEGYEE